MCAGKRGRGRGRSLPVSHTHKVWTNKEGVLERRCTLSGRKARPFAFSVTGSRSSCPGKGMIPWGWEWGAAPAAETDTEGTHSWGPLLSSLLTAGQVLPGLGMGSSTSLCLPPLQGFVLTTGWMTFSSTMLGTTVGKLVLRRSSETQFSTFKYDVRDHWWPKSDM